MAGWIGRVISKVEIQQLLGRGGMAEVYLGRHITLERLVAVKVLHGHLSGDEVALARFRSEAQSVANIHHPHIVQVFDFDVTDEQPYIVMELLPGPSLADYLNALKKRGKTLPPEQTSRLISDIASALDYAHTRGIVHRDVKPSNVLLRRESGVIDVNAAFPDDAEPVLTDFGVARIANATVRTASGVIVGTPAYMSPEQVSGEVVDARSDIYSLGIMLYGMLSGRLPFDSASETVASTLIKHITEDPPPLPEVSPAVQAVVMRALDKDRTRRYQKAGDLAVDLRAALGLPLTPVELAMVSPAASVSDTHTAWRHPPKGLLTISLLLILTVIVGSVALLASGIGRGSSKKNTGSPGKSYGTASFGGNGTVELQVTGLPDLPSNEQYEAWLLGDETRRSIGVLALDKKGNGSLSYTDDKNTDLLSVYGRFEITVEPNPDTSELPSNTAVYHGSIPPNSLIHIRHLLVEFGGAPNNSALVIGMMRDANLISDSAQAISHGLSEGNLDRLKSEGEAIVNIIEGEDGTDFGDVDKNGEVINPADGFGLLPGSRTAGYIQTSIEHARYASGADGATPPVIDNAKLLETAAQNVGGWATQLRDLALQLAAADTLEAAAVPAQQIIDITNLLLNGQDTNANGIIEASEGGVNTVYAYALRMADMSVYTGSAPDLQTSGSDPHGAANESGGY